LIALEIDLLLGNFIDEHDLGYSIAGGTGYQLSEWTVRAPDFGYIRQERLADGLTEDFVPLAPDLAAEVISPEDKAEIIHGRVLDLLSNGPLIMWVLYPTNRTAVIHTPDGSHTIESDGILDGGDVLPGFSVPLSEVFSVLK
jgi:Uma2 family endonuclease